MSASIKSTGVTAKKRPVKISDSARVHGLDIVEGKLAKNGERTDEEREPDESPLERTDESGEEMGERARQGEGGEQAREGGSEDVDSANSGEGSTDPTGGSDALPSTRNHYSNNAKTSGSEV